jgi:hypothetical protein
LRENLEQASPNDPNAKRLKDTLAMVESGDYAKPLPRLGKTYEVNIHADPEAFLDWDAPLSQQGKKVQNIARETAAAKANQMTYEQWTRQPAAFRSRMMAEVGEDAIQKELAKIETGQSLYRHAAQSSENSPEAAVSLKRRGIPGIKYLDQGSRSGGEGTRNYVVFDDKLVSIVRKYVAAGFAFNEAVKMAQADVQATK